jgi:galacturan 1,4-alpha-galacturonidase
MWTMTVIHSENILLEDIYVNSTGNEPVGFEFSSLVSHDSLILTVWY